MIQSQSPEQLAQKIKEEYVGEITLLAPIVRQKKGTYEQRIIDLGKEGFTRVRVNGKIIRTDEKIKLERYKKHDIDIVIDRIDTQEMTT